MGRDWDVVVIGDGLAGRLAALAAAERGAAVHLVADAEDASRHGSGLIDVLGHPPDSVGPHASPFEAIATLPSSHPYARLGIETVRSAFGFLDRHLDAPYVGLEDGRNAIFPGPVGTPLVAFGYPCSVRAGSLSRSADLLLVDVDPLTGFDASMAARTLREADPPAAVDAASIDLSAEIEAGAGRQWIASRLDREVVTEPVERSLAPVFREALESVADGHARIGIPAMLGVDHWPEIHRRIDSLLDPDVFEIPTGPPSVLGMRLDRAVNEAVASSPVYRTRGPRAVSYRDQDGSIQAVGIEREATVEWVAGSEFVLATGGLIGGGLRVTADRIEEPLFGCPVDGPGRGTWTAADPFDSHPFARSGVAVDDALRPLAGGTPLWSNLRAAGDVLGHFDPVQEGSGAGVAVATGYAAGRAAAREVDT